MCPVWVVRVHCSRGVWTSRKSLIHLLSSLAVRCAKLSSHLYSLVATARRTRRTSLGQRVGVEAARIRQKGRPELEVRTSQVAACSLALAACAVPSCNFPSRAAADARLSVALEPEEQLVRLLMPVLRCFHRHACVLMRPLGVRCL